MRENRFAFSGVALFDWSQNMRPSQSRVLLALSLLFFAGLAGCGPASSDNAPSLESRVSVGGPSLSMQGQSLDINSLTPITQAASSMPVTSGNSPGAAPGNGTVPGEDKLPVLGIPKSIAKGLDSLDVRDRIQALDHWEKKGAKPPLDPVFEALEDENDAVRAKATAIIEQQWAIERERERS